MCSWSLAEYGANDRLSAREPLDYFGQQIDPWFRAAALPSIEARRNGDRGGAKRIVKYLSGPINARRHLRTKISPWRRWAKIGAVRRRPRCSGA